MTWTSPRPRGCGYCDAELVTQDTYNCGFCSIDHWHKWEHGGPAFSVVERARAMNATAGVNKVTEAAQAVIAAWEPAAHTRRSQMDKLIRALADALRAAAEPEAKCSSCGGHGVPVVIPADPDLGKSRIEPCPRCGAPR